MNLEPERRWARAWKQAAKAWRASHRFYERLVDSWERCYDDTYKQLKEARYWAIRMKRERDEQQRLREMKYRRNMELIAEKQALQTQVEELEASNKLFSDCLHRAQLAYKEAHPDLDESFWPDGAEAFVNWVEGLQAELDTRQERRCETCRKCGTRTSAIFPHKELPYCQFWSGFRQPDDYCSRWEARDEPSDS